MHNDYNPSCRDPLQRTPYFRNPSPPQIYRGSTLMKKEKSLSTASAVLKQLQGTHDLLGRQYFKPHDESPSMVRFVTGFCNCRNFGLQYDLTSLKQPFPSALKYSYSRQYLTPMVPGWYPEGPTPKRFPNVTRLEPISSIL